MELRQLRCFVAAAESLHFGEAARQLGILPAVLGRQIQVLESSLRVRLFRRSTRHVALTEAGRTLLPVARRLLTDVDALPALLRGTTARTSTILRIGAIDSAAAGLMPRLITDLRQAHPDLEIALVEDKTVRLIPKLLSGQLDLAFVRPPDRYDTRFACLPLFNEHPIVALPVNHPLAQRRHISISDLYNTPMILPSRRSRPHSHDLTVKLFEVFDIPLTVAQEAEEKHTILSLVASGIGAAIVPRWSALAGIGGVIFLPIDGDQFSYRLPLGAMWLADLADPTRDMALEIVRKGLLRYAQTA